MSIAYLRTSADSSRVDRVKKIIYGAALLKIGRVRDARGWLVTRRTLEQALRFSRQQTGGVKARFDHPSKTSSALGSYLGQWRDFRIDGDFLRADLHLSELAFKTPSGDLGSYVLDMAEFSPDSFGASISAGFAEDFDGKELSFSNVLAFDIVDSPAGTDGMFCVQEPVRLSKEQRQRVILEAKRTTARLTGKEIDEMTDEQKYEAQYEADLQAMGGRLSVSKADYIASLKRSADGGTIDLSTIGTATEAATATHSTSDDPADAKYRDQYRKDLALVGHLSVTEDEYVASLKRTAAGGVVL